MKTAIELAKNSLLGVILYLAPRFSNVVIFIAIGRLAGPSQAGVFALATTYVLIFTAILRGLDDLLVRQVAREPEIAHRYLASFLLLRLCLATLLYVVLAIVILIVFHYPPTTTLTVLIVGLSIIPDSLTLVAQAVMVGLHRFGMLAFALGGINFLKLILGIALLLNSGTLVELAWLWLLGSIVGVALLLSLTVHHVGSISRSDWLAGYGLKSNWRIPLSFIFMTTLVTLEFQVDVVLLSILSSEAAVGWYNAATTITATIVMLSQAYRLAVYPMMTRSAKYNPFHLSRLYEKSMHYLTLLIIPSSVGLVILAPQIIALIYGPKFTPTVIVLQVLSLALIFQYLSEPNNRMILVHDHQQRIVQFSVISLAVNLGSNLLLIPIYSALGAAIARVISSLVFFVFSYRYVKHYFFSLIHITRSAIRPVIISAIMALAMIMVGNFGLFASFSAGAIVYLGLSWIIDIPSEDKAIIKRVIASRFKRSSYISK